MFQVELAILSDRGLPPIAFADFHQPTVSKRRRRTTIRQPVRTAEVVALSDPPQHPDLSLVQRLPPPHDHTLPTTCHLTSISEQGSIQLAPAGIEWRVQRSVCSSRSLNDTIAQISDTHSIRTNRTPGPNHAAAQEGGGLSSAHSAFSMGAILGLMPLIGRRRYEHLAGSIAFSHDGLLVSERYAHRMRVANTASPNPAGTRPDDHEWTSRSS